MPEPSALVDISPLGPLQRNSFAPLTFPAFRWLLDGPERAEVIASGGAAFGQPVALALARSTGNGEVEVLSAYVSPAWRRQRIAARLLESIEESARARGASRLSTVFVRPAPCAEAFQRLLAGAGWEAPKPRMLLYEGLARRMLMAPWVDRVALPAGFSVFAWGRINPADEEAIRSRQGQPGWHGPELCPFSGGACEPETSVGLRFAGEVVGWVVTHRVVPGYLRYTSIFVVQRPRLLGIGTMLLTEAVRRHAASSFADTDPLGALNVALDNRPMIQLVQRRVGAYMESVKQSCGSTKEIGPARGGRAP